MTEYHCSVALAHYARKLSAETKRGGAYQATALLAALWLEAGDPFAFGPVVYLASEYLVGLVPNEGRMRQLVQDLRRVGAIAPERERGGYRLVKPAIDDLDGLAQKQIARARAQSIIREQAPPREKVSSKTAASRRHEVLSAMNKQPSDVRTVLAVMAGKKPSEMRYAGKGSQHVQLAADWIAENEPTWATFVKVCRTAHEDKSVDKPSKLEWLFAERNSDYLERILTLVNT